MGDSTVMLSEAKHLAAQRDRPFAALRVTVEEPISSSGLFFETALSWEFSGWEATLPTSRHPAQKKYSGVSCIWSMRGEQVNERKEPRRNLDDKLDRRTAEDARRLA
jgi:hypothetical protein